MVQLEKAEAFTANAQMIRFLPIFIKRSQKRRCVDIRAVSLQCKGKRLDDTDGIQGTEFSFNLEAMLHFLLAVI